MSDNSIIRDGALVGDALCAFDHTVLDQSGFYPADMSGLPTSTPNPANLRRKSRRSWFETTPKGFKFDIAVEKPVVSKRPTRKSETVEVLTLSHFSSAPRLDFGTMKPGQEKTCTLLLRNPHDYEQSVKVEKVPEKKNFSVPSKQFVVGPDESYALEITWCPKEPGGCREMVLMLVDGSYRVQAYVFGTVTAPPAQKKKGKRVGLLASKAARPFSVIHTTSLASINQQYSPEKKTVKQSTKYTSYKPTEACSQLSKHPNPRPVTNGTQSKGQNFQTQSKLTKNGKGLTKDRKSSEGRRRSGRLSDKFQAIKGKPISRESTEDIENIDPDLYSNEGINIRKVRKSSERKASLPKPKIQENIPRKKMRRSNTYSNVSGLGLVIPIIHGEAVKGLKDTSLLHVEDCNISGVKVLEDSVAEVENCNLEPSFLEPREGICVQSTQNKNAYMTNTLEPSFLDDDDGDALKAQDNNDSFEPSFMIAEKNKVLESKVVRDNLEPSFLEGGEKQTVAKSSVFTALKNNEVFHDSLEAESHSTEATSFLLPEKTKSSKPRRSLRKRSGIIEVENSDKPTGVKLLRGAKRNNARAIISPETFVKDVCLKNGKTCEPLVDEHKPLNDSVGQSSLLEQLKNLKSFVHDKSLEIEKSETEAEGKDCVRELERRETFMKRRTSPRFSIPGNDVNIRRGTFVTEPTKLKMLETQKPSEASPRRTTFTVAKGSNNAKQHVESRLKDDVYALHEEEGETGVETETNSNNMALHENKQTIENNKVQKESGRLFSADSLENDSFDKQTQSPQQIFAEQKDVLTRRATLTVTKSRPSDALLEHAQRSAAAMCIFEATAVNPTETIFEVVTEKNIQAAGLGKQSPQKSCQNSTFEVPSENSEVLDKNSSFPTTPYHQLPTSPHLDHSRRSTHIVEKPKVVNLSRVNGKQLFVKQDNIDQNSIDDLEVEQDSPTNVEAEKKSNSGLQIEQRSENYVDPKVPSEMKEEYSPVSSKERELENFAGNKEDNTDGNDLRSSNTRRRKLSARRSVTTVESCWSAEKVADNQNPMEEKDIKNNKDDNVQTVEMGNKVEIDDKPGDEMQAVAAQELFFVPFDNKPEEPTRQQTKKPDPRQFLKKRSNPVTQEDDKRSKRVKSDSTDVIRKPAADGSKYTRKAQETFVKQSTAPLARVTRQTVKSVGSIRDVSSRQGLKPKTASVKGLAQSKLILTKKSKSAIPKHPLPFAAKNMFYDERWMEKQERGFVNWLNFILTPPEEHQGSDVKVKVDAGKLTLDVEKGRTKLAPTNEILSFRTYSAQRKLNRLRKSSCRLFQSDLVRRVIQKIEGEVESNRLLVRKDKMLHADLGAKQKILDMLLSYNPLWLRVGLETIYGEVVPLQCNTDVYGLSRFIIVRVLASPDISEEYAHPTVPHLYRDGYAEATAQHTLKRFLMLVYFLDQAKQHRLIDHNPCLFCKNADTKTSKDMLLQFSRDFLSGEGDITRHLGYLGYKVTYSQSALDEFDFAVKTLATDLRDGLRLTRVLEVICSKTELSKSLRVPAISRLQKVHNVEVAFNTLTQQNIDTGNVTSRDVVDGHRERTLCLLWKIILHYQVAMVINMDQIEEEIQILERSLSLKKQLHRLVTLESGAVSKRRESEGPDLHTQDERLNLLMKWCRAVCAFYDIKIENFTVSFSDGRALCHILHYYHPGLLPLSQVKQETSMTHLENIENHQQSMNCSLNDSVNSSAVFGDVEDPAVYEQLLANEKENFKLLSEKVKELGGVPMMLRWSDMSNTIPDEKVVVTYLMYLCARLLDIRHESRAARVIQHAWRAHRLRKMEAEYKVKHTAAVVIQQAVRKFLSRRKEERRQSAALCIQSAWRGHRARSEARRLREERVLQQHIQAIRLVQKAVKSYLHRRRYLQMKSAVTQVQAYCRGYLQRKKLNMAATIIQRVYRGHHARCQVRQMKCAAITIQAGIRGFLARKALQKHIAAAKTIQDRFRTFLEMKRQQCVYHTARKSCITIQRCWRKHLAMKHKKQVKAAVKIQSSYRSFIARKNFLNLRDSAICLQAGFRGFIQRQEFNKRRKAVYLIQRRFRDYLVTKKQRREFLRIKEAVVYLQSQRRMIIARRRFLLLSEGAAKLQAYFRMFIQRREFQKMKSSAVTVQMYYRAILLGRACRRDFLVSKGAAITIQAAFRGHIARQRLRKYASAAVIIQSLTRCFFARKRFLDLKSAALMCQQKYRAKISCQREQENYTRLKNAALIVQKMFRGRRCRMAYKCDRENVIKVQSMARMFLCRRQYKKIKQAVSILQVRFRAKQHGDLCRRQYLITLGATITLQAGVRGFICRQRYRKTRQQIVCVQAVVRGHLKYVRYQKLKQSTITIQRRLRETLVARQQRSEFMEMKMAAVVIQATWRMALHRKKYLEVKKSAVVIQSHIRGVLQQKTYLKQKAAAVLIQKRLRETMVARQQRSEFNQMKCAAVVIQCAWRMRKKRQVYLEMKHSATVLQSAVRRFIHQKRYKALKTAVSTVEKSYCAKVKGESCRRHFLVCKGAVMTIQAAFRGHKVRKSLKERHYAALKIQTCYRGHTRRKQFQQLKDATVYCQRRYRSVILTRKLQGQYVQVRNAVITVQSTFKRYIARKQYLNKRDSAIKIQSAVRGYLQCQRYQNIRKSVLKIQRRIKETLLSRQERSAFLKLKNAVIVAQSALRMKQEQQKFKVSQQAAILIQSTVRRYIQQKKYKRLILAAKTVQKHYRAKELGDSCRREFLIAKGAVMTIQAWFRGYKVRKQYRQVVKSAIVVQSAFRCYSQHKSFFQLKHAVLVCQRRYRAVLIGRKMQGQFESARKAIIHLQAAVRAWTSRREFLRLKNTAVKIQALHRMQVDRRWYLKQRRAAVTIQRWFRGAVLTNATRRDFLLHRGAALTIQANVKMYLIRKLYLQTVTIRKNSAAVKIQSCVRGFLARQRFGSLKHAVIICQSKYRAKCQGRQERQKFVQLKKSTITVQACFRRLQCQRYFKTCKQSAVKIQSWFRGVQVRRDYRRQQHAAIVLQTRWRAELLCRQQIMRYHELRDAVIAVQSMYRGRVARNALRRHKAAVKIQANYRMMRQRKEFCKVKKALKTIQTAVRYWQAKKWLESLRTRHRQLSAAVTLQSGFRAWQARKQLVAMKEQKRLERERYLAQVTEAMRVNMAAMVIQRCYRNHKVIRVAQERLHSVIVIQRWMRSKLQRKHYLQDRQRVICIQSRVRTWLVRRDRAARVIQSVARRWLGTADSRKQNKAALKIQALWKGFRVRNNIKSRRLTLLRKRVQEATASATEEKKLGNRTSSALDFLLKYKQLSQVLDALLHLEVASRLSWICCERMVEVNAISVLYRLVRSCNRSLPHMEIIKYTVNILTNLAKYEKTRPSVYETEGGVNTLVDLMQIYREKGQIFNKICTLLGIIALDTPCKMSILEDKKLVDRLRSIHTLTARKHKLEENQRVTRARMNASSLNATFMVRSPMKKLKIKPDWSLHKDKMSDIENPLKAINFVLGNLGIQANSR